MATLSGDRGVRAPAADGRNGIAVVLATVAMSVLLVGPRAAPFMLLLLVVALVVWRPSIGFLADWREWPPPIAAAVLLGAYVLVNAAWSFDRSDGLGKAALFSVIVAGVAAGWRALPHVPGDTLQRMTRGLVVAFAVALAYLVLEELSNHLVKRTLFSLLPALRPDPKHVTVTGEIVSHIALYVSNRNMAAVNFVLWPVLLGVTALFKGPRAWPVVAALWLAAALAIWRSQHETSAIALVLSLAVFLAARAAPRLVLGVVAAGWIVATLLVVPMVAQAYKAGMYTDKRLPMSAQHRVILWGYTAEQVPQHFWRGVGVDSTKPLDAARQHEKPADHNYPRRTGTHAHNLYLQAWYELGAIGAGLLLVFGLAVLAGLWRLETGVRPFALAAFAGAAAMAAFSFGMWQPWYMASFGISALLMLMMAELSRRPP